MEVAVNTSQKKKKKIIAASSKLLIKSQSHKMCFKLLAQTIQSSVVQVDLQSCNMDVAANLLLSSSCH